MSAHRLRMQTTTPRQADFPAGLMRVTPTIKQLYYLGDLTRALSQPCLAVVGSRKVSAYGRNITTTLTQAAAKQGITIVSGLALGIDSIAHQAALDADGVTIAVLPCGLDRIYPASHRQLAEDILRNGGALVSEYPFNTQPYKTNFLARNRIIAGLAGGVLIPEAALRSGSISTANHALNQGKTVLAVPGNITSDLSAGTNNLIKAGAVPVTDVIDILTALDIQPQPDSITTPVGNTAAESAILTLLSQHISDSTQLHIHSQLDIQEFNQTLSMLEITGKIRPLGGGQWGAA